MARTVEEIVRNYIGDQVLQMAKLTCDNERLQEELAAAKAPATAPAPEIPFKPNGKEPVQPRA
jgi:hypothetical protein